MERAASPLRPPASALDVGHFQAIYIAKSVGSADSLCVIRHWHAHATHVAMMLGASPSLNWTANDIRGLTEFGFQLLSRPAATWPAVLSTYTDHFLPWVARRLGTGPSAKQQRVSEKQRSARATLEASWAAALGEDDLGAIRPALSLPALGIAKVPMVSNSLVIWAGPHQVLEGCSERVGHYISCPTEEEARLLPKAFFDSIASLSTPTTAMGSRRSTAPDRALNEVHGSWGASTCPADCLQHLLLNTSSVGACPPTTPEPERAASLAAALKRDSYVVLPDAMPPADAQRLESRIVDNVVQVVCRHAGIEPGEAFPEPRRLLKLLNASAAKERRALYDAGEIPTPHLGVWRSEKMTDPPPAERQKLVYQNVYQVLKKGMLDVHHDPLFYELAARHLVAPLAALRSGLTGAPAVRILFGPERQTVRLSEGFSKAPGLDWHKDQPCVVARPTLLQLLQRRPAPPAPAPPRPKTPQLPQPPQPTQPPQPPPPADSLGCMGASDAPLAVCATQAPLRPQPPRAGDPLMTARSATVDVRSSRPVVPQLPPTPPDSDADSD